jgi:thioredoxin-related protein
MRPFDRKSLAKVGAFLLTMALTVSSHSVRAAAGQGPAVQWRGWDRGLEEAKSSGRPVIVDVYTDWCGWCRRMEANVYSRPEVRDYLSRKFVAIKLDAEASDAARYEGRAFTSRSLAARFGVSGYPTTLFLRPAGEHLVSVPGYVDADRFLQVLRYIGDGHMDRGVTFQDFSKQSAPPRR